jgi:hypothetical protein
MKSAKEPLDLNLSSHAVVYIWFTKTYMEGYTEELIKITKKKEKHVGRSVGSKNSSVGGLTP